jgi:hypothetical protein
LNFSTEFNDDKTVTNVWLSMSISERKVEEEKRIRQAWKENYCCRKYPAWLNAHFIKVDFHCEATN